MPINPNWFSQNAPQMQPGGGGFQEQQPGAMPLPNTGVTGGFVPQAGFTQGNMWQPNTMPDAEAPAPFANVGQAVGPTAGGRPFMDLMRAGQFGQQGGTGNLGSAASLTPQGNVLLRAPDGSTKSVPAHQMGHWLSRGAARF